MDIRIGALFNFTAGVRFRVEDDKYMWPKLCVPVYFATWEHDRKMLTYKNIENKTIAIAYFDGKECKIQWDERGNPAPLGDFFGISLNLPQYDPIFLCILSISI